MKLYLDDKRIPIEDGYTVVENVVQFIEFLLKNGIPDFISFDHDLAAEHYNSSMYFSHPDKYNSLYNTFKEPTGLHACEYLIWYCQKNNVPLPVCNVHSANPVGSKNIYNSLVEACVLKGQNPADFITKDEILFNDRF